jgi:hypothetical protein
MGPAVAEYQPVTTIHFDFGDRDDFAAPTRRTLDKIRIYAATGHITAITDESARLPKRYRPENNSDDQLAIVDEMFINPRVPILDIERLRKTKLSMRLHFNANTLVVTLHDEKEPYPLITKRAEFILDFFVCRPDQAEAYQATEKSGDTQESTRILRVLAAILDVNFIANGIQIRGEQSNEMFQQIYKTWLYVREHEGHSAARPNGDSHPQKPSPRRSTAKP